MALSLMLSLLVVGCASTQLQPLAAQAADTTETADAVPAKGVAANATSVKLRVATQPPRTAPVTDLLRIAGEEGETGPGQTQIGRYTSQDALPPVSAAEPLEVYAQLNFPRGAVRTIGDAIRYVLLRTGYRLVDETRLGAYERQFLALPLPENQRTLGPYQVRTILNTLLGPAWQLRRDPITRDLWFTVSDSHLALIEGREGRRPTAQATQEATPPVPTASPQRTEFAPAAVPVSSAVVTPIATTPRPVIAPPSEQLQPRLLMTPHQPSRSTAPIEVATAAASRKVGAKPPPPQVGPAVVPMPAPVATLGPKPTPVPGAAPLIVMPETVPTAQASDPQPADDSAGR